MFFHLTLYEMNFSCCYVDFITYGWIVGHKLTKYKTF